MKTLKEIQKEAYIFLRSNWTTDQKQIDFIDSLITKAYEAGMNDSTGHECISDWNMYLSNPPQNKCKICGKFFR